MSVESAKALLQKLSSETAFRNKMDAELLRLSKPARFMGQDMNSNLSRAGEQL